MNRTSGSSLDVFNLKRFVSRIGGVTRSECNCDTDRKGKSHSFEMHLYTFQEDVHGFVLSVYVRV